MNIVKIPRELIYNKSLADKRVAIYSYCTLNSGISNSCYTSCSTIISWCGMKMDRHSGSTNDKFSETLKLMQDSGYISNFSQDTFKNAYTIIEMMINRDKFFPTSKFAVITQEEIDLIRKTKISTRRTNKPTILLVLAYIRINMIKRSKEDTIETQPQCFYRYINTIEEELGISRSTISSSLDILQSMNIIKFKQLPKFKVAGKWKNNVTLFVNATGEEGYNYEEELKYGERMVNRSKYMMEVRKNAV